MGRENHQIENVGLCNSVGYILSAVFRGGAAVAGCSCGTESAEADREFWKSRLSSGSSKLGCC